MVDDDVSAAQNLSVNVQSATGWEFLGYALPLDLDDAGTLPNVDLILIKSRSGPQRVRALTRRCTSQSGWPSPRGVILGVEECSADLAQFIEAGATSYVPREALLAELIAIGRSATNGADQLSWPAVAFGNLRAPERTIPC